MPPKGKKGAAKKGGAAKGNYIWWLTQKIDTEENEYQEVASLPVPESVKVVE